MKVVLIWIVVVVNERRVVNTDILIERDALNTLSSNNIAASADQAIELPSDIGGGISYGLDLDAQTKLMLTEVNFYQGITFDSEKESICGVFIVLEGELNLTIAEQEMVTITKNNMAIFFLNESKCQCSYSAGKSKLINFSINSTLMARLAEQCDNSPVNQSTQGDVQFDNCLWTMPIIPDISGVIKQIYHSELTKNANKIYLQAKVMEVLSLAFHWYQQQKTQLNGLTTKDFNRILNAAQLVESKMKNPPSLPELARLVGINDNKLKKQFKLIFKRPVFDYLHYKRMEKAEHLFIHSDLNVKQVAEEIGFKHLGYFSAQFKKGYELSPSQFIKKYRSYSQTT